MTVPGALYSLLLAVGTWCIDYFTSGDGSASLIAPVIVAAVPIVLKMFTVQVEEPPAELSRGVGPTAQPSKMKKWLLGG